MAPAGILLAILKFATWEAVTFGASAGIGRRIGWKDEEWWLGVVALQVTLESSVAAAFSFAKVNSSAAYWIAGACLLVLWRRPQAAPARRSAVTAALMAALVVPLLFLAFRPVEEIDSINYLHYLIDWMGNRATPYTFATNFVAFWELSFLPAWTVTGVDFFFPLIALKAVILLALAGWLLGREFGLRGPLLAWTLFGGLLMRHYWHYFSGVPTLKNDALHGIGFVLTTLVVIRAARGTLERGDVALLALGMAFAPVKYTGLLFGLLAIAAILWFRAIRLPALAVVAAVFLLTSGHYYLRSLIAYGSPFYPFQINAGPIHLPGTADLSYSSILYNLRDPRLWRALFWPAGGISPAGILFPEVLAGVLLVIAWQTLQWLRRRGRPSPIQLASFCLAAGWLLYFRSVYSACSGPGDLAFILNDLNSVRYVDGVLLASELLLASLLGRFAFPLVLIQAASRLLMLYAKVPLDLFPIWTIGAAGLGSFCLAFLPRFRLAAGAAVLLLATPWLVARNRAHWTTYWNELKPLLQSTPANQLVYLGLEDGGYFAGHVVAAGNPVRPEVRMMLPAAISSLEPAARPDYLAVMVTPGSEAAGDWRRRYGPKLTEWGYRPRAETNFGALLERRIR